jgi:hypothetical protein
VAAGADEIPGGIAVVTWTFQGLSTTDAVPSAQEKRRDTYGSSVWQVKVRPDMLNPSGCTH